ncbi:MAG: hypothetical protein BWZ10_02306 [candidate division BRC1 bacterium ADurb.BinA364]|nr:MAG: hypothetical protein BWZ10_02306 [candidate division BRC1 bacterium ADurb.BinA364]
MEANGLFLSDGREQALLVSCDLGGLRRDFVAMARAEIESTTGIPRTNILVACTHMHSGPVVSRSSPEKEIDEPYHQRLKQWLVDLACRAKENAKPARIGWGMGNAQIGYNRRLCWADGTHTMYGDARRADFTGLEGPDDPRHLALFAEDLDKSPIAVFHNNTAHPCSFYGHDFYSADYPGEARGMVRRYWGNVPVLYFNGALGDIITWSGFAPPERRGNREQIMLRTAHLLAGETLRLLHVANWSETPMFACSCADLPVAVQLPSAERLSWAADCMAAIKRGEKRENLEAMLAYGALWLQEEFARNPVDHLPIHTLRIGDVAIAAQPCELFCQFGIDIKRRSPAPLTAVCSIVNGYMGYCPTMYGILGGGYSGEPIYWRRLAPEAGYRIVDEICRQLHAHWRQEKKPVANDL